MYIDALALFSDAQNSTVSVASTNVVDTLAAGDSYEGAWFVVRVNTAFTTATTVPTFTFQLQTAETEDFSGATPATLVASAAYLASQLTAGKFWAVRIPPGAKRYLRGYKVVSTNTGANYVTAAVYDMFIVKDIALLKDKRYQL
jgi:hypothetical protein